MKKSHQKVVLVTGGSRGIGKSIVQLFKENSWIVSTCATQESNLNDVQADIKMACDVSNVNDVKEMIQQTVSQFGKIDVLVNNAGLSGNNSLDPDSSDDIWHQVLNVNLNGTYYLCKYASTHLPNQSGRIINIASILALKGVPDASAYCAAKHGVLGLTRALAQHLSPRRITVNAICPGWVRTDMAFSRMSEIGITEKSFENTVPLGRFVEPREVAEFTYFLANSSAGSMITGQALSIDGGVYP